MHKASRFIIFSTFIVLSAFSENPLTSPPSEKEFFTCFMSESINVFDGNKKSSDTINFNRKWLKKHVLNNHPDGFFWELKFIKPSKLNHLEFDWGIPPKNARVSYSTDNKEWIYLDFPENDKSFKKITIRKRVVSVRIVIPPKYMVDKIELKELRAFDPKKRELVGEIRNHVMTLQKSAADQIKKKIVKETGIEEVVYVTRGLIGDGHWYANFGYYAQDPQRKAFAKGGSLCKMNLKTGKTKVLLEDHEGTFRDPAVHYDGKTVLFSYRKGGTDVFHLYEIQSDGTGLKQITSGIYDDIEPCYLPDDKIMFVSARARRWVNCWLTPVATLYSCDRTGKNIRQISANIEHDNTPWVLRDGRVIYQRWEYIDRSQLDFHHLWTTNPDGTSQMVYFGNQNPGNVYLDAKPMPDSDRVVFIVSPGHGRREHEGRIATVSERNGPDDLSQINYITKDNGYRDPYPLSSDLILAARGNEIVIVQKDGEKFPILISTKYGRPNEPRPLIKRQRERIIPERIDLTKSTGTLILTDVYHGRNMKGVKRGEIKKLLVVESLPKPINYTGSMEPMTYGGSFTLERILGTVPVEPDGSAHFEVPANTSLLLVALDENDSSVKRMQSFLTVMPGEISSCVGCHEERSRTPIRVNSGVLMALKRPASQIKKVKGIPDIFDYPKDIQPILDKHCVNCHNPKNRKGGVLLTGDHGPIYSHSFYTLTAKGQIKDGRNLPRSNYAPRELGDSASPLMKKMDGSHHDVKVPKQTVNQIRYWLNAGAHYLGTYAALGCGMIGTDIWIHQIDRTADKLPTTVEATKVLEKRCISCHSDRYHIPRTPCAPEMWARWRPESKKGLVGFYEMKFLNHIIYNFTKPDQSIQLLAPLAQKAGGYSACRRLIKDGNKTVVSDEAVEIFKSKKDPDYQTLLKAIEEIKKLHDKDPRWNMPGFIPPPEYIREMKRYGVLPESFDRLKDPIDFYKIDRRYWDIVTRHYPNGDRPKTYKNSEFKKKAYEGKLENSPGPIKGN